VCSSDYVDWAFSRERYWGTPLNIWQCPQCAHLQAIGSVAELKSMTGMKGLQEPLDLHRPYVDGITFSCECGGAMQRVADVMDCWFDSGAMPVAQQHYPFQNEEEFRLSFPADFICEAVDQTRGWFYSLHAIATMLFDSPAYRNVICLGHVLDAKGEKMSKTRGNVVDPFKMLDKYSGDSLRWYLLTSAPAGNVRRFDEKGVEESLRKFLLTLWNTYSFFVTYANIDKFNPVATPPPAKLESQLDRWILSALNQLALDVDADMRSYDPTSAARRIDSFVDDLSNWYVRRSRRRFWKSESDTDKLAAHHTLYRCLTTVARLSAPFIPFMAEEMYGNLVASVDKAAPQSVHLSSFPVADASLIDTELSDATRLAIRLCSLGRAARAKAAIKVRQPLERVLFKVDSEYERKAVGLVAEQVLDELNVKTMEFVSDLDRPTYVSFVEGNHGAAVSAEVSPELALEGMAREIVHRLQTMRRTAGFDIADHIVTYYEGPDNVRQVMGDFDSYIRQETLSDNLVAAAPADGAHVENMKLAGQQVILGVKKVG